ncbi:MAG: Ig-like domain-containing protein [Clostridia bacterium]|nr:Ig-like domain-containing protein [Clostridia bacterium]
MTHSKTLALLALLLTLALLTPATLAEDAGTIPEAIAVEAVAAETPPEPADAAPPQSDGDGISLDALVQPEDAAQDAPMAATPPEEAVPMDAETPMAAPGGAPVLAIDALTLGAKDKRALPLTNGADPASVGAVFASSNPKIAAVDAATGVVTAKKVGTATITMSAMGVESACSVTVVKAPKKIALSAKKLTLGVGEEVFLAATLTPDTVATITFSTSNGGVVAVGDDGHLTAVGVGKATVTARTHNNRKATCKVTVMAAPEYVALPETLLTLWQGRGYDLKPALSPGSGGTLYCQSSDPGVVSVEGTTIRGQGMGSATVTVSTYNGHSASALVQVTRVPVYRALLVGENHFPGSGMSDLPGSRDVALINGVLSGVKGPSGSDWAITCLTDLTAGQIRDAIRSTFAGAEEGDVSLFYISTHGDETEGFDGNFPEYAGYLQTYPDYAWYNWYDRNTLTLVALASWLGEVPGQVIVLIDSCGSGAAIYGAMDASHYTPEGFDRAVVDAFRDADVGVMAPSMDRGAFVRENKFYVLTSADYREMGWSLKGKYSYFAKWLSDGIKTRGRMPADADKNHMTTLHELFSYLKKRAEKKVFRYNGVNYRQHVQVYPANSGFELFYR